MGLVTAPVYRSLHAYWKPRRPTDGHDVYLGCCVGVQGNVGFSALKPLHDVPTGTWVYYDRTRELDFVRRFPFFVFVVFFFFRACCASDQR